MGLKISELRQELPIMPEDKVWGLLELYTELEKGSDEDDINQYRKKIPVVEAELERRDDPNHKDQVDEKAARKVSRFDRGIEVN